MPSKKKVDVDPEIAFSFRVHKSLRDSFSAACKNVDTSASRELRMHMKNFVKKYGQDNLF